MAGRNRHLDAALRQRVQTRLLEVGRGQIAKAEQRPRGVAGADELALARKRQHRRIDAFDQALQPLDQRHGAAVGCGGCDQDAVAAVGKIEPCAAAGHKPGNLRAEAAQPFQPDGAAR